MACPTCDHTIVKIGVMPEPYTEVPLFYCTRCGTIKANEITEEHDVPRLVVRMRDYADSLTSEDEQAIVDELRRRGILESISCLVNERLTPPADPSQE